MICLLASYQCFSSILPTYKMTQNALTLLISLLFVAAVHADCSTGKCSEEKVIFVNVIFRHGDRTPTRLYPNDPHKNSSYWSDGLGQLTNSGKRRAYELGKWLRQRYDTLLTPAYSKRRVHVLSRDLDRCLMSAQAVLAAAYPPQGNQRWLQELNWQPIPVHMTPKHYDKLMEFHSCPVYMEEFKRIMHSEEVDEIEQKFSNVYSVLNKYTGNNVTNINDIADVYDTLLVEKQHNLTLPEWTHEIFPHPMKEAREYSFALPVWTPQLGRFRGGLLIKDLVHQLKHKVRKDSKKSLNIALYSASDSTIVHLLKTLQLVDLDIPPYSCAVLMELSEDQSGKHSVSMFYRNSSDHEPHRLTLPGCNNKCPLDQFVDLTSRVIPKDWEKECGLNKRSRRPLDFDEDAERSIWTFAKS